LLFVVLAILVVAAFVLGGLRWIDTDSGRAFVARQLPGIKSEIGLSVHVDRIDGSIFGTASFHGVTVSDPKGVFAQIPRLDLDWRPVDLATRTFTASRITAPALRVLRLPQFLPSNSPTFFPDFDFAIGRFRIDRLVLEAPVSGQRRMLGVGGNAVIHKGRALVDLAVLTLGKTARGGGDTIRLHLDTQPDADKFDVDALIAAPAGGAIATLLKLPAPLSVRLAGDGSWKNWAGRLDANLGGNSIAAIAITGKNGRFTARGTAIPSAVISGLPARLLALQLAIDTSAQLRDGKANIAAVIRSAALDFSAHGNVNLTAESFDDLAISLRLLKPGAIGPSATGRDVRLSARIAGSFVNPIIDYRLSAASLGWGTTLVTSVRAAGIVRAGTVPLVIPVTASAARINGLGDTATPLLTNVRIDGALRWANGILTGTAVRYRSDRLRGTVTIIATPATGAFLAAAAGEVQQIAIPVVGLADVSADLRIASGPTGPGVSGPVRIRFTRLDSAAVAALMQGLPVITADLAIAGDQSVTIRSARLSAPGLDATASGRFANGVITAVGSGAARRYGAFNLAVTGPLGGLVIDGKLARPGLGIGLSAVTARLAAGPQGWRFDAEGQSGYGPIVTAGLVRTGTPLTIDLTRLSLAGLTARGTAVQTPAGPFVGRIDIAGRGLTGGLALSAQGDVQRADVTATARQAQIDLTVPVTINAGDVKLAVLLPATGPTITGAFNFADIRRGDVIVTQSSGTIAYAGGRGRAVARAAGNAGIGFTASLDANLAPDTITATASGTLDDRPITLSGPAIFNRSAGGWALVPVTIITPEGKLIISGQLGDRNAFKAQFDRVSLSLLSIAWPSFDVSGRVTGAIDIAVGADGIPVGAANLRINALSRTGLSSASSPVDIGINAALGASASTARAVIVRSGKVEGRAQIRIGPIPPGSAPLGERLFASPVFGQWRYAGRAEAIWGLAGINGVDIRGQIAISADISGVLGNPQLVGTARSEGGRVEATLIGAVIDQASLEARFTQSRLELVRFGGRVGKGGSISATGGIDLAADRSFAMDIRLAMTNAELVKRDDLMATATGNVRIATDQYGGVISGKLRVDNARYRLGTAAAIEVPVLPVTEINSHVLGRRVNAYTAPTRWLLNMDVAGDRRLFVSGMGLESEWRADLKVRGPITQPLVTGRVELVRGDYDFAGKRFSLTRGDLRFDGVFPPDPTLNVSANSTANGFTAQLDITGTAQRPQISFSSVPALPEDEVLSRILFGESVTNLSAPEAVQLAGALASLRGGSGSLNPINLVRKGLGIDRLRILPADIATGRKTAIAAGQYIGRSVYLELATDAQGYSATRIEVSLTRSLSILSEVSTLGGTSVNLRWKRDY
jgi:translocation and assembly module TamB